MKTVYLAGPIDGLTYDDATDWRETATADLADAGIKGLSPMRCKSYLANVARLDNHDQSYGLMSPLSTARGIMTRDRFDATRCDVMLVNLLGAPNPSMGTVMEMAWADLRRTPIVCMIEADGSNPHEHPMVNETIGFRATSLSEALDLVKALLA